MGALEVVLVQPPLFVGYKDLVKFPPVLELPVGYWSNPLVVLVESNLQSLIVLQCLLKIPARLLSIALRKQNVPKVPLGKH